MGKAVSKEPRQDSSGTGRDLSYVNGLSNTSAVEEVPTLHVGPINSLTAVDEHHLVSGGADQDIILYSWTHHINRVRFRGPTKGVTKVNYNVSNALLHAASRDRTIYQWKWPENKEKEVDGTPEQSFSSSFTGDIQEPTQKLEGHTLGVTALASTSADDHILCSGSRDNSVCLWDVNTAKAISCMSILRNLVTGLEWINLEKAVLQSSEDKTLRVWDLRSCSVVQHFKPKQHVQTCCAVSEDSNYFLSGSSGSGAIGGELTLWDRRMEKALKEYRGHSESIHSCLFLSAWFGPKQQEMLVSAGSDSTVKLWEREAGGVLHSEYVNGAGPITSLTSPADGLVACSSFRGGVSVWKVTGMDSNVWTLRIRAKY